MNNETYVNLICILSVQYDSDEVIKLVIAARTNHWSLDLTQNVILLAGDIVKRWG